MLQNFIHNWLVGGADPEVGLRLFMDYCFPNQVVSRILSKSPDRYLQIIRLALLKKAELAFDTLYNSVDSPSTRPPKRRIRNDWPFLSDPECPPELKLLISDKITVYTDCIKNYNHLTNCSNHEELLHTVSSLVTNYIENHEIYQELSYYKKNGNMLGVHPIFQQMNRLKELRDFNTMDLFKKKKNLEHAIWRNESKIKKENRPDLLPDRQKKIKALKLELSEVNRLLQ